MPAIAPPLPQEGQAYRPLSTFAVLGLLLGLASPLIFLVNQAWMLLAICLPALVFSVLARRRIAQTPDSLAGYIPATFGVVLAVASGLGWATHVLTADWIREREARAFLEQWIEKLQAGHDAHAFLDTVEPAKRQINFEPEPLALKLHYPASQDSNAPLYDVYRGSKFVSTALLFGPKVKLTPLGRPEITHFKGDLGTMMKFRYQCSTPVGDDVAVFTVATGPLNMTTDGRREWYVAKADFSPEKQPTPFGKQMGEAVQSAEFALGRLCYHLARGDTAAIDKLFIPGVNRADFDRLFRALRGNTPSGVLVPFGLRQPTLVLKEQRFGEDGWEFVLASQMEDQNREAEFEVGAKTDQLRNADGWRFTSFRFLGERRKTKVEPVKIDTPKLSNEALENFRTR